MPATSLGTEPPTAMAPLVRALGWLPGVSLSSMGGIALLASLLPFLPGDARWEIAVLGPMAQASLLMTTGLYLLGVHAVLTSTMRVLAGVLVATAFLIAFLTVGVITVLLDLWLLVSPSGIGGTALTGLQAVAAPGVAQGTLGVAAVVVVSVRLAAAFHLLRARR